MRRPCWGKSARPWTAEHGGKQDPAQHDHAHALAILGPLSAAEDQREADHEHGQGGHDDGTEAKVRGLVTKASREPSGGWERLTDLDQPPTFEGGGGSCRKRRTKP